jgi:hypothetical protein
MLDDLMGWERSERAHDVLCVRVRVSAFIHSSRLNVEESRRNGSILDSHNFQKVNLSLAVSASVIIPKFRPDRA